MSKPSSQYEVTHWSRLKTRSRFFVTRLHRGEKDMQYRAMRMFASVVGDGRISMRLCGKKRNAPEVNNINRAKSSVSVPSL